MRRIEHKVFVARNLVRGIQNKMSSSQEQVQATDHPSPWDGDILGRQEYAKFLTNYLKQKTLAGDGQGRASFTMAIDAQWGQGKTFFVTNWAMSLAKDGYPSMIFDAWKADYAADPVVAFMAEFKSALDEKIESAGLVGGVKERAGELMRSALSGIRRALLPAGKQIAKSLLHKATGIAADEIMEACGKEHKPVKADADVVLFKDGLEIVNKGLDEFFDKALEEHGERKQAIDEFRLSVEMALKELVLSGAVSLPMFVFIDELDRCRPSFAIALLEGVKHLFGIPGVCFVVSTNMTQLSHSIKAVYGEGFDGQGYLKRFFDVEASLPEATGRDYMAMLVGSNPEILSRSTALGLPATGFDDEKEMNPTYALTWVAEAFSIDLRSQRSFVEMIVAAIAGIPENKQVFLLWLAAICAIKIKSSEAFELLVQNRHVKVNGSFSNVLDLAGLVEKNAKKLIFRERGAYREGYVWLREVLALYNSHRDKNLIELNDIFYASSDSHVYPNTILGEIIRETPSSYTQGGFYPTSLVGYFDLVNNAGYLAT